MPILRPAAASLNRAPLRIRISSACGRRLFVSTSFTSIASAGVWDVFESALGKRPDALQLGITNSGFDRNSVCYKQREYSDNVLRGIVPDDTWFGWVCGLDAKDIEDPKGYEKEENWIKANPCLGGAVKLEDLRSRLVKANADPSSLNTFLRFRLCVWTTEYSEWMPMDNWNACCRPVDREMLHDRRCFGALDLSTVTDVSAFVLLFEPVDEDPYWRLLPRLLSAEGKHRLALPTRSRSL